MKAAISILIVIGVIFGVYKLWEYWDAVEQQKDLAVKKARQEAVLGDSLPGLPYELEEDLRKAREGGPETLKAFIERVKKSPKVSDPRLAWIELEYVKKVSLNDPIEAKRAFREVKERIDADSPVYKEVKRLEKTYE
jgi:hypothetical protein